MMTSTKSSSAGVAKLTPQDLLWIVQRTTYADLRRHWKNRGRGMTKRVSRSTRSEK
jgi:hypothetical protein